MKLEQLKKYSQAELSLVYDKKEAESLFFILLEAYAGISKMDYLMDSSKEFSQVEPLFKEAINQLKRNVPYQYVLGYCYFYGLKLAVNSSVLIPRPETEELVDWILKDYANESIPLRILDLGCGSGCISLALAKHFKQSTVWGVDVSEGALEVAKSNAKALGINNVHFEKRDMLNEGEWPDLSFDLIVSNPPYIAANEAVEMEANVLNFEPHTALFVEDESPLLFYKVLASLAEKQLSDNGKMFLEINQQLGDETLLLYKDTFRESELRKDLSGNDRFIRVLR